RAFLARGFEVHVIAPKDDYSDKLVAQGVVFHEVRLRPYAMSVLADVLLSIVLWRLYRRNRYDIVFHYTLKPIIYGSLVARLTGTESIAITTGLGRMFAFENFFVGRGVKLLLKVALHRVRQVWALNEKDINVLRDSGLVREDRLHHLPSEGIDTNRYRPIRNKSERGVVRFLFVGRLLWNKGIGAYVNASAKLRSQYGHVQCEVLGFIEERHPQGVSSHQVELWQKKGWINYLGNAEDVRPYLDRADCVVLPSWYNEGVSRALLEAASMSTSIITTDQYGCAITVQHGKTGYIVPKHDQGELLRRMTDVALMDRLERMAMGQRGREFVRRNYRIEKVIDRYLELIEEPLQSLPYEIDKS
ncbi:MAG: glycosyltransferase family 4 protein, partial [Bacteroidota bacterium]